jgi:hypothetical protein
MTLLKTRINSVRSCPVAVLQWRFKPRRQCEGERGQAVRREVSFREMRFVLRSDITFGCPCLWGCSCHQALQWGDMRRQTKQKKTLKSWLILSTIRCSVTMIMLRNTGVQLTAESGRRKHSDNSYCTGRFTAGLLLVERTKSSLCSDRWRHHFYSAQFCSFSC